MNVMTKRNVGETPPLSRRGFLLATGGAGVGLLLGSLLPAIPASAATAAVEGPAAFNAFVRIGPDGMVTVLTKHLDMGQGTASGLATLVAEELDAAWEQMRVEHSPADAKRYNNLFFGEVQGTGGSTAIANSFEQYRTAGAAARAMLIGAAAKEWGVPASEITVEKGRLAHGSGKQGGFGDFAAKASSHPVPEKPALKDPSRFVYIGKSFPRLDVKGKTEGASLFAIDVHLDDMLTAAISRPPKFGAKLKSFDATAAKAVPGVVDVIEIPAGVAVVARGTWPAFKGREALTLEWDESQAERRSSDVLFEEYRRLADLPGVVFRNDGDAEAALAKAAKVVEGEFSFPYLAHAPMEPHDVVIEFDGEKATVWTGSQLQSVDQTVVGKVLGIDPSKVDIHTLWAGGSFGRRATPDSHIVAEAAMLAKAWGKKQPLKIQWSREDDIRGGYYRPMYVHKVKAGLDANGKIVAWHHRIVGQSILGGTLFEAFMVKDGIDETSVEGVSNIPYAIPNMRGELQTVKVGVPVLWWRSVGHTHTAYVVETMIDDLAKEAGRDPVEMRLEMLDKHPRHRAVLQLAAAKAGWGTPLPEGRARGVAVHESFHSFVAEVAEVSTKPDGGFKVEKVVCAVDCGIAVNPDNIKAQMEGGIGYGLGHALRNEITLTDGAVDQSNFHDYEPMRITDMPVVETHIMTSGEKPTGVGEPGVPPAAPAVANALFSATGKRIRRLPFSHEVKGV